MSETGADQKAEKPERLRKAGGGTAENKQAAHQADTACNENTEDRIPVTLEEVLCRENMLRAYQRVLSNKGAPGVDGMARRIEDKRILRLIRRYLQAGMMEGGLASPRVEGTPQGGPLSPLLSNILLDELDQELERRGHRFVRYADDCNIYVRSRRAGERVLTSTERFLRERLRLTVNPDYSCGCATACLQAVSVHRFTPCTACEQAVAHCADRCPFMNNE